MIRHSVGTQILAYMYDVYLLFLFFFFKTQNQEITTLSSLVLVSGELVRDLRIVMEYRCNISGFK